jgi:hypothetical protein
VDIDNLISDKKFWDTIKVCVKVLFPDVKDLRYSDGMRGGNLGLMYNLLLQLDQLYSSSIEGLPDKVRTKVSARCIVTPLYSPTSLTFVHQHHLSDDSLSWVLTFCSC